VTDPRHPLFGQRFPLLSISSPPHRPAQVFVASRDGMVLRIPLASTTLAVAQPPACTKLTFDAVADLLRVAEDCEALCPLLPPTSGSVCPPSGNNASQPTSRRSSRRSSMTVSELITPPHLQKKAII
jgi:hypothetical protein